MILFPLRSLPFPALRRAAARRSPALGVLLLCGALQACSSPPLRLYTMGAPAVSTTQTNPLPQGASPQTILAVARVALPDYLDSQDILIRNGQTLERSPNGRWADRLSVGISDLLAARIRQARPDLTVTDTPLPGVPAVRVLTNITRFDVARSGSASLVANWVIMPTDSLASPRIGQASLSASGSVATDSDVVALMHDLSMQLADRITQSLR